MRLRKNDTPLWLKKRLYNTADIYDVKSALSRHKVDTVCVSSLCPNLNECFSRRFAAFLILGNACTRSCAFCAVTKSAPQAVDRRAHERIARAVRELGIKYVIITSVTRDDLADGGARQFADTIRDLRAHIEDAVIEVLVPDFNGSHNSIGEVLEAGPDIFGHNIETVRRVYPVARSGADYDRSLDVLAHAKRLAPGKTIKSGIMLGLGETCAEVIATLLDLRRSGCDLLTVGQYLRPGPGNLPVRRFVTPEEFARYMLIGREMGFKHVASSPFTRSSYFADEVYENSKQREVSDECAE